MAASESGKDTDWKRELETILATASDRDPGDVMTSIFDLANAIGQECADALLDDNPQFLEHRTILKQAYYEFYSRNEIAQAKQFLEDEPDEPKPFSAAANPLSMLVYNRAGDLRRWLDLQGCRRVVLVGSGWIPLTLFYFSDHTDVPELVGLDINAEAVATANKLAKRFGYTRVRTELQDGASYDYSGTQIVYVVSMASPMPAVLSRIADTAPDNLQLIVTELQSLGRLWNDKLDRILDSRLEIIKQGRMRSILSRDVLIAMRPKTR